MSLAAPPSPSGCLWAGPLTLAPHQTPDPARARSALLFHPSFTVALAVTAAQAARRPYIYLGGSGLKISTGRPEYGGRFQSL